MQITRDNINNSSLRRVDLLTREDIKNVRVAHHVDINDGVRHKSDIISVDLWVQEYKKIEDNILFYKKQGDEHPNFDKNDFILVFVNQSQQYMLQTFGKNIICIDSTHGLNSYDFELTTLMKLTN